MATLFELRQARLDKLSSLKSLGVDCYPAKCNRNIMSSEIVDGFDNYQDQEVIVAGRIFSIRGHGGLKFMDLCDYSGKIQLYIRNDSYLKIDNKQSELTFQQLELLDLGDFIEAYGKVTKTQRGEISILISILTKTLRPLPDKWDGIKDKETRLRRRYLELATNETSREKFVRRSVFWQSHRDFLNKNGFIEINTPILEETTGGADANPFITHMDSLDEDYYLRISQELPLKKLIGGGYERIYDIGARFRNEGISDEHLPEHIAMEYYMAYQDWKDGINFTRDLFRNVAIKTWGKLNFKIKEFEVDLSEEWKEIEYQQIIFDRFGIDIFKVKENELKNILIENRIKLPNPFTIQRGLDYLWKDIRKTLAGPFILVGEPKFISPLAKSSFANPEITERFHPIIAGSELGNGFSELNDPMDQLERFMEQQKLRDQGDNEAMMLDLDFVEMLEYGMPPTFGYGHSERVFWFFENVTAREGVPFPQLRREIDPVSKQIYPELFN